MCDITKTLSAVMCNQVQMYIMNTSRVKYRYTWWIYMYMYIDKQVSMYLVEYILNQVQMYLADNNCNLYLPV